MGVTQSKKRNTAAKIEDKKRQMEEEEEEEERPWQDLLPELVLSIVESLSLVDRFNVSFALPKWKPTMSLVPSMPYLLQIANCESKYSTFNIRDSMSKTGPIETSSLPCQVSLLSSNYGWLLLNNYALRSVFFFNPLTKAVIRLPPIEPPFISLSACFSAPPTSPECIVFLGEFGADAIRIMFCYRGDDKWTELLFENRERYIFLRAFVVNSVFYKEKVYWLGVDRRLGVFDPVAKSWVIHGSRDLSGWRDGYYLLVQSGEDLFRIWACCVFSPTVHVYKLEANDGYRWKETRSLDGRCFFVSFYPSITFSMEALRGEHRDKIYFHPTKGNCFVYDACQARTVAKPRTLCKPCLEYCCWVEPKWDHPSFEQLRWF